MPQLVEALKPNIYPQFAVPFIEQYFNRSTFTDRPVVPKYLQDVLSPDQYQPWTSESAKVVGRALAKLGLEHSSFASPLVIDNYIKSWGGGLGQHAVTVADKALRLSGAVPPRTDPSLTNADIPILKAFAVRHPSAGAQPIQDFYDAYEEQKRVIGSVKLRAQRGQDGEVSEGGERGMAKVDRVHKALGRLIRVARDAWFNTDMTADEKRALIDGTYMQAIEIAKEGIAALDNAAREPAGGSGAWWRPATKQILEYSRRNQAGRP